MISPEVLMSTLAMVTSLPSLSRSREMSALAALVEAMVSSPSSISRLPEPMPVEAERVTLPVVVISMVASPSSAIAPELVVRFTVPPLLAVMLPTVRLFSAARVTSLLASTCVAVSAPLTLKAMSPLVVETLVSVRSPLLMINMPPAAVACAVRLAAWISSGALF